MTAERLRDPQVAFFARMNPGHARGDELACLTELSRANLTRAGQRMVAAPAVICHAANTLWLAGCLPEAARFRRATARVREEQARVLRRLLRNNAATEFGRRHGFSTMGSVREYQQRVPLLTYEDYRPSIDRLAGGSPNVLTREAGPLVRAHERVGRRHETGAIHRVASAGVPARHPSVDCRSLSQ